MKNILIPLVSFLIACCTASAQDEGEIAEARPLNTVAVNLLGDASLFSIQYERHLFVSPTFLFSAAAGFGFNKEFRLCFRPCPTPADIHLTIPHRITGNAGDGRHFFEFGLGGAMLVEKSSRSHVGYGIVGYRFLPLQTKKLSVRAVAEFPLYGYTINLLLPVGFSLGLVF